MEKYLFIMISRRQKSYNKKHNITPKGILKEITDIRSDSRKALVKLEKKKKKVTPKELITVKLGNSDNLSVGEWVIAIGSPFGFDRTVTAGIVSGKKRNLPNENYVPYIQTDVA